uniref:Uncharacterized protein n=1 Tax=Eutreptiella gymnastica TaxID=73025 RepID=A0A7S4GAV0_9EUGL
MVRQRFVVGIGGRPRLLVSDGSLGVSLIDRKSVQRAAFMWSAVMEGVLYAAHARCVHWGEFVDLPVYWTVKCMCFQAVKVIAIAHTALCPLTRSPVSLSWGPPWLPAGISVTYPRSNGDRVPATVISASECGQYVSIE